MAPTKDRSQGKQSRGLNEDLYYLEFDGASKGNPGQAGAGALLRRPDGTVLCQLKEGLGTATCNSAEYCALIMGLQAALDRGIDNIKVQGDSNLVCKQINGNWKVSNNSIRILWTEAKRLQKSFKRFSISHVPRELNAAADALANAAVKLPETKSQMRDVADLKKQKMSKFELDQHDGGEVSAAAMENSLHCAKLGLVNLASECSRVAESLCTVNKGKRVPSDGDNSISKTGNVYQLEYESASIKNPGKAGIGALLRCPDGSVQLVLKEGLGITTSNAANYHALIAGLRAALDYHVSHITVQGNSDTVIKQMSGVRKVRDEKLKTLWKEADELRNQFKEFTIMHVDKKMNATARDLALAAVKFPESMYTRAGFNQNSRRQYSTMQSLEERRPQLSRFGNVELKIGTGSPSALACQSSFTCFSSKSLRVSSFGNSTWPSGISFSTKGLKALFIAMSKTMVPCSAAAKHLNGISVSYWFSWL